MFSAEAHEERRASAPTPTSRVPTSRVSYHRQWLADNFGHGHDKLIQTKKREVRSAAATELKLEVPFYEMSASFYLRLLYVLLAKFIQLFRLLNSTSSFDILQRFRLVSYV